MPKYELTDAVNLFSQYTAMINKLWAVYAAAAFAAAGYGLSTTSLDRVLAIIILVGFWFLPSVTCGSCERQWEFNTK
jgi:hypothetical protein